MLAQLSQRENWIIKFKKAGARDCLTRRTILAGLVFKKMGMLIFLVDYIKTSETQVFNISRPTLVLGINREKYS
jgi:hypothetical protein